jgi:hypothetical protein
MVPSLTIVAAKIISELLVPRVDSCPHALRCSASSRMSARTLSRYSRSIKRLKLDVAQHAPIHGNPGGTAGFKRIVAADLSHRTSGRNRDFVLM